jgi:hypothetical protein
MEASEVWNLMKSIAGILFVVLIGLYVIHCFTTRQFISVDEFDVFIRKVVQNIFSH